jgi:hypothetical protein
VYTVRVVTEIAAPTERVFDLVRSTDLHVESTSRTGERIVVGVAGGLLELGDQLTFEGRHLGIRQRLSARIVEFDRPGYRRDELTRGAF